MAETRVENQVCQTCGANIRLNALFCYSCGSAIAPQPFVVPPDKKDFADTRFREESLGEKNNGKPIKIEQPIVEQDADKPILETNVGEAPKLKSAAAMRRKSKIYQPKRIEIVWEERENALNGWFIGAAITLTLLAAGIFYLAIYLK